MIIMFHLNGKTIEHGYDEKTDYFPELQAQHALDFLNRFHGQESSFLMVISTPATHSPFTLSFKYKSLIYDESSTNNNNN